MIEEAGVAGDLHLHCPRAGGSEIGWLGAVGEGDAVDGGVVEAACGHQRPIEAHIIAAGFLHRPGRLGRVLGNGPKDRHLLEDETHVRVGLDQGQHLGRDIHAMGTAIVVEFRDGDAALRIGREVRGIMLEGGANARKTGLRPPVGRVLIGGVLGVELLADFAQDLGVRQKIGPNLLAERGVVATCRALAAQQRQAGQQGCRQPPPSALS